MPNTYVTPSGTTVGSQATGTTVAQKTVATSTSPAVAMAADPTRKYLRFTNNDSSITIYLGGNTNLVAGNSANANGGIALKALDSYEVPREYAGQLWWAVSASATPVLGVLSGT